MRIRKRLLSSNLPPSLPPLSPSSDPQLGHLPTPVQSPLPRLHPRDAAAAPASESDAPIGREEVRRETSAAASDRRRQETTAVMEEKEELIIQDVRKWKEEDDDSNYVRNEYDISSAGAARRWYPQPSGGSSSSSSSEHRGAVVEKWFEEDKAVPLKKRRGSFERRNIGEDEIGGATTTITKARMKCKTNKKCSVGHEDYEIPLGGIEEDDEEDEDYETKGGGKKSKTTRGNKKKKVRGSVMMEGSRCSRVNGRGWRCCQPTLVGYSLCEHHLGKGRLRSMNSVRNRSATPAVVAPKQNDGGDEIDRDLSRRSALRLAVEDEINGDGEGIRKNAVKRKGKIGMVKARSISSLLSLSQASASGNDDHNPAINGRA